MYLSGRQGPCQALPPTSRAYLARSQCHSWSPGTAHVRVCSIQYPPALQGVRDHRVSHTRSRNLSMAQIQQSPSGHPCSGRDATPWLQAPPCRRGRHRRVPKPTSQSSTGTHTRLSGPVGPCQALLLGRVATGAHLGTFRSFELEPSRPKHHRWSVTGPAPGRHLARMAKWLVITRGPMPLVPDSGRPARISGVSWAPGAQETNGAGSPLWARAHHPTNRLRWSRPAMLA